MSKIEIPRTKDPLEPIEWARVAQDLFVNSVIALGDPNSKYGPLNTPARGTGDISDAPSLFPGIGRTPDSITPSGEISETKSVPTEAPAESEFIGPWDEMQKRKGDTTERTEIPKPEKKPREIPFVTRSPRLPEVTDLGRETFGLTPERFEKELHRNALDRIFEWYKGASTGEKVVGGLIVVAAGYVIYKAIDKVVDFVGNKIRKRFDLEKNNTVDGIVKIGVGALVLKLLYDVVTSEDIYSAFLKNGLKGVGALLLAKIMEGALDWKKIGESQWKRLQEKIPQLPDFGNLDGLVGEHTDALDKARDAMKEVEDGLRGNGHGVPESIRDRIFGKSQPNEDGSGLLDKVAPVIPVPIPSIGRKDEETSESETPPRDPEGGDDGFLTNEEDAVGELADSALEAVEGFAIETQENFEDVELSDTTIKRINAFMENPSGKTFGEMMEKIFEEGGELIYQEGKLVLGMLGGFVFDYQKFIAFQWWKAGNRSVEAELEDAETTVGSFMYQHLKESPKFMIFFAVTDQIVNLFTKGYTPRGVVLRRSLVSGLGWGVTVPIRMISALGKITKFTWTVGKHTLKGIDGLRTMKNGMVEFFAGKKLVARLNSANMEVEVWRNGKFETVKKGTNPEEILEKSKTKPVKIDEADGKGRYLYQGVEYEFDEDLIDQKEASSKRPRIEIIKELCEIEARGGTIEPVPVVDVSGGDDVVEEVIEEVADEPKPKGPGVREVASEAFDETKERVSSEFLPEVRKALEEMNLDEGKITAVMDELAKPHWVKAMAGFAEVLGHSVMPAFVAYMAYDMKFGDSAHDPQDTVATHLGFIAAFTLGAEGLKKGGSVKSKLLLGLVGVATPLLAAYGVQTQSVEDFINEKFIAGDYSKAFWNAAEDALGVAEFYLANRLLFQGALGRALGSQVDNLILRPALTALLKAKVSQKVRDIFVREGVKKLATKAGLILATKGASATAVNVVPVAGQVASIGMWLWTAWDVGKVGLMLVKAQKVQELMGSQADKTPKSIDLDEVGERSIRDKYNAFKVGTPYESYEFESLPKDIQDNYVLQNYQDLPDCRLTITREDGSQEMSHWTSGDVRYVKIIEGGETTELTEEDLNTEAESSDPPAFTMTDIPYADLEAQAENGGEAIIEDYFRVQVSSFRAKTEWSKLDPEVVDSKKIIVKRTGNPFDSIIMEREGDNWTLSSEKKEQTFEGDFSFHSGLAYAGMLLHSIGFLYDEVHVEKNSGWQSEGGGMNPFYEAKNEIKYAKDDAMNKRIYGRDWVDFYVNDLQLDRSYLVTSLNQYFALHAEDLDLIGD